MRPRATPSSPRETRTTSSARELGFIDARTVAVDASMTATWTSLTNLARSRLCAPASPVVRWLLRPAGGAPFAAATSEKPERLIVEGQHRFASYAIEFQLSQQPEGAGCTLEARSSAAFPGSLGRIYRALVVSSHGHAFAVRTMLAAIARDAERRTAGQS